MRKILEVRKLSKSFGGLQVFRNISFSLFEGSSVGLIGPNGAGKTTLINVITAFLRSDEGEVLFEGKNILNVAPWRLVQMGVCRSWQLVRVFGTLTVRQCLKVASMYGQNRGPAFLEKLVEEFGFKPIENVRAMDLSFGHRKMLSIAMTIATRPKLLILDEPFMGLSPDESEFIANLLRTLKGNVTQLIIDHKIKEIFSVVDKVLVLASGSIIAEGSPSEVSRDKRVIEAYLGGEGV